MPVLFSKDDLKKIFPKNEGVVKGTTAFFKSLPHLMSKSFYGTLYFLTDNFIQDSPITLKSMHLQTLENQINYENQKINEILQSEGVLNDKQALFTFDVLANVSMNAPATVMGILSGNPYITTALFSINVIGNEYPEIAKKHRDDFISKWEDFLATYTIEVGGEHIPILHFAQGMSAQNFWKMMGSMIEEVLQENLQSVAEMGWDYIKGNDKAFQNWKEKLAYTTAITSASLPLTYGVGYAVNTALNKRPLITVNELPIAEPDTKLQVFKDNDNNIKWLTYKPEYYNLENVPTTNFDIQYQPELTQRTITTKTYEKIAKYLDPNGETLDFGAGMGLGFELLKNKRFKIDAYEPFPVNWKVSEPPTYKNKSELLASGKKYKNVILNYVLNVVDYETRKDIYDTLKYITDKDSNIIITVRSKSDIKNIKNAKPVGEDAVITSKGTYQEGFDYKKLTKELEENGFKVVKKNLKAGEISVIVRPIETYDNTKIPINKDFDITIDTLENLYEKGKAFKDWYERARRFIEERVGYNEDDIYKYAGILAITSGSNTINSNLTIAERIWNTYKEKGIEGVRELYKDKIKSRHGQIWFEKVIDMLENGKNAKKIFETDKQKIKNYYETLVKGNLEPVQPVLDRWMARIFGISRNYFTEKEYEKASKIIQTLAKKHGITPQQYQASVWAGIKLVDTNEIPYAEYHTTIFPNSREIKVKTTLNSQQIEQKIRQELAKIPITEDLAQKYPEAKTVADLITQLFITEDLTDNTKVIVAKAKEEKILPIVGIVADKIFKVVGQGRIFTKPKKQYAKVFYVIPHDIEIADKIDLNEIAKELGGVDIRILKTLGGGGFIVISKNGKHKEVDIKRAFKKYGDVAVAQTSGQFDANFEKYIPIENVSQEYLEEVLDIVKNDENVVWWKSGIFGLPGKFASDKVVDNLLTVGKNDYNSVEDIPENSTIILPENWQNKDMIKILSSPKNFKVIYKDKNTGEINIIETNSYKAGVLEDFIKKYGLDIITQSRIAYWITEMIGEPFISPDEVPKLFTIAELKSDNDYIKFINKITKDYHKVAKKYGLNTIMINPQIISPIQGIVLVPSPKALDKSLSQFAKVLGIPKKAVGLGGNLIFELSYGTATGMFSTQRGSQTVIKETEKPQLMIASFKDNVFAHEWGHAFDVYLHNMMPISTGATIKKLIEGASGTIFSNYINSQDVDITNKSEVNYENFKGDIRYIHHKGIRPEIAEKIYNIINKLMNDKEYDNQLKFHFEEFEDYYNYLKTPTEMFARAFSEYVYIKNGEKPIPFIVDDSVQDERHIPIERFKEEYMPLFDDLMKSLKIQKVLSEIEIPPYRFIPSTHEDAHAVSFTDETITEEREVVYLYKEKPKENRIQKTTSVKVSPDKFEQYMKDFQRFKNELGIEVEINETKTEDGQFVLPDIDKWLEGLAKFENATGIKLSDVVDKVQFFIENPKNKEILGATLVDSDAIGVGIREGSPFAHEFLHSLLRKADVIPHDPKTKVDFTDDKTIKNLHEKWETLNTWLYQQFEKTQYFQRLVSQGVDPEEILAYAFESYIFSKMGENYDFIVNWQEIPNEAKPTPEELLAIKRIYDKYLNKAKQNLTYEKKFKQGVLYYIGKIENFENKAYTIWINSLLSAVSTHLMNITSNSVNAIVSGLATTFELKDPKVLKAYYKGMAQSIYSLLRSTNDTFVFFKTEEEPQKYEGTIVQPKGKLWSVITFPTKALTWEDAFFKSLVYHGRMFALAEKTISEGNNPYNPETEKLLYKTYEKLETTDEKLKFILDHPPQEFFNDAVEYAREITFTNETTLTESLRRIRDTVPFAKYIVPFLRTPTNILTFGFKHSPFGLVYGIAQNNPRIIAQGIAGTLLMGLVAVMQEFGACGDDPDCCRITDDICIKFEHIEPIGKILEAMRHYVRNPDDINLFSEIFKGLMDSFYLYNITSFVKAISTGRIEEPIENTLVGFIPNMLRRIAIAIDPTLRKKEDFTDKIIEKIPFVRETLKPKFNLTGTPIKSKQQGLSAILTYKLEWDTVGDPQLARLFKDLGVKVYPLPPLNAVQRRIVRDYYVKLKILVNSMWFKKMPKEVQKRIIYSILKQERRELQKWSKPYN